MATLVSPGVSVSVIDESFYVSSGPGTVPLIIIATQSDKLDPSGTALAEGTLKKNAGKLYLASSQRELLQYFGAPYFAQIGGTAQHGYELNEYGLLAAHSYLGIANRAYILRADVDLAQLEPRNEPPVGNVPDGTYWLDTANTKIGLYLWNTTRQTWVLVPVKLLTDITQVDLVSGAPLLSAPYAVGEHVAVVGDIDPTTGVVENQIFRRDATVWTRIETDPTTALFYRTHTRPPALDDIYDDINIVTAGTGYNIGDQVLLRPAVALTLDQADPVDYALLQAATFNPLINTLANLEINNVENAVIEITGAAPSTDYSGFYKVIRQAGNSATIRELTLSDYARFEVNTVDVLGEVLSATLVAGKSLGASSSLESATAAEYSVSASISAPVGTGLTLGVRTLEDFVNDSNNRAYWFKTTAPTNGTVITVKQYLADANRFVDVEAPLSDTRDNALLIYGNDPQAGDLFVHYDYENNMPGNPADAVAQFSIMRHNGRGETVAQGRVEAPILTAGGTININGVDVVLAPNASNTLDTLVQLIINANIPGITVAKDSRGRIVIRHSIIAGGRAVGRDITILDTAGSLVAALGLESAIEVTNGYVHSNWSQITYIASNSEPTQKPLNGTLWYSTEFKVDILENNGLGSWDELTVNLFLQPAKPFGAAIGDLWIDTDQVADYPVISRYIGSGEWIQIDTTDQTSPDGILFADARPNPDFGNLGFYNGPAPRGDANLGFPSLDADAPDALLYPRGMLLWNTRYSTRNVKEFVSDYTFNGVIIGDRWVTKSGNQESGAPWMGGQAVKEVIVEAMAAAIASNDDIRAESVFYNLIAAPGYPEMIDEMVSLNADRKLTAFVIGDTPFNLRPDATSLRNWATNSARAPSNGDKGLVTADTYLGVYYPNAYTTNIDGEEVVAPASHIALRTMAFNDQVAYQWFAPAGYQRGVVQNAVNVGFVNGEGEFVPVELSEGQRDVLYDNKINPIAWRPNRGLVVFGQKSRHPVMSAQDRINVVRLINYIRYQAPLLAEPFLFEPNDQETRDTVRVAFERFLSGLVTLRGLYDFAVVVDESNNTPARIDRNELWIDLLIQPVKAIEYIYIPVRIRNTGSSLALNLNQ